MVIKNMFKKDGFLFPKYVSIEVLPRPVLIAGEPTII